MPDQETQPPQKPHDTDFNSFIDLHSVPAPLAAEQVPPGCPGIDPARTRLVQKASFSSEKADGTVTRLLFGPDEDTVLFVDCSFDFIGRISFHSVNAVFHRCKFSGRPSTIVSDRTMSMTECAFLSTMTLAGRGDSPCLELEGNRTADKCNLYIGDFQTASVKDCKGRLVAVNCDSLSIDGFRGTDMPDNTALVVEYGRLGGRDTPTHELAFSNCDFDSSVLVIMNQSAVAIHCVSTRLAFLTLESGIVRSLEVDAESSIAAMAARDIHFSEPYRQDRVETFPLRCSGEVRCNDTTIYKKLRYFPWYMAPLARFDRIEGFPVIAELSVPPRAERNINSAARKVRVSEAMVVRFYRMKDTADRKHFELVPFSPRGTVRSTYDRSFSYREGQVVYPTKGFCRSYRTCAPGIHGFLDPADAANY